MKDRLKKESKSSEESMTNTELSDDILEKVAGGAPVAAIVPESFGDSLNKNSKSSVEKKWGTFVTYFEYTPNSD